MKDLIINQDIKIEDLIYNIRGKEVMLDSDLAKLYHVETKRINEAVKNNSLKFPNRFCFYINEKEYNNLRSKISTTSLENNYGGRRYTPRVFTEQGVYMLATILKSSVAIEVSIKIMDAFVTMRNYINSGNVRISNIETKLIDHDNKIEELFNSFNKKDNIKGIYFKGETFKAYSDVSDILTGANKNIVIIDNYADKTVLDLSTKIDKKIKIIIITDKSSTYLTSLDVDKYNEEYDNLSIIYNKDFHDRYIIIDKKKVYHLGSSTKDIGNKITSINLLSDIFINKEIINKVKEIINNK